MANRIRLHTTIFALAFLSALVVRLDSRAPIARESVVNAVGYSVAVLVVSSACRASRPDEVAGAFRALVTVLDAEAVSRGEQLHTIGLSIDADPIVGLAVLKAFGAFDEIAVGGAWNNTSALHYVVREIAGEAMVPQIVILHRIPAVGAVSAPSADSLIARLRGVEEIRRWSERRTTANAAHASELEGGMRK
jgi:hypothetical protein